MRATGVFLAAALGVLTITTAATGAALPEYVGVFEAMTPPSGFTALERQTPQTRMKVHLLGFGGASSGYQVDGERSPVRLKAVDATAFVVRTASQDTDPSQLVQFFTLQPVEGKRIIELSKAGSMGLTQHDETAHVSVKFTAQKYGTQFFLVKPLQPLPPGEYGLGTADGKDLFLFGVDQ